MTKAFIGFLIGVVIGIAVMTGTWLLFVDMTVPFTRDSLERQPDLKLFAQDITTFHEGSHDMDTYHTWFTFQTGITNAADYFSRVEVAIQDSDWKLLDSHKDFRLYVNRWVQAADSEFRLEIGLRFDPRTRTVSFEEQRRYD
jgi:hypothetical protein